MIPTAKAWRARLALEMERGQAMVETAIAFPLLLLTAIGLVQFALYYHAQNVVIGAVQDGARVAAEENRSVGEGVAYTQALLQAGLGPSASDVRVQGADGGDVVVLEAQGRLHLIIPWVGDGSVPLRARAVMRKEGFRVGAGG